MLRSGGDPAAAYPLFVTAFERATAAGEYWFAGDAAHMAALAAADDEGLRAWTTRGVELGEQKPAAAYWRGPLLNNLGWSLHEQGAHEEALAVFEQAPSRFAKKTDQSSTRSRSRGTQSPSPCAHSDGRAEAAVQAERAGRMVTPVGPR